MDAEGISRYTDTIYSDLINIRRDFHQNPERSGEEERTARIIAQYLTGLGLEVKTGLGGHGVVGYLSNTIEKPVIAYRADMDGIEINLLEVNEFSSKKANISHGCGHDIHITIALGIANVLSKFKSELKGSVLFVFQPSEENLSGAAKMLEDGVFEKIIPQAIFAVHVGPFECGQIAVIPGLALAGFDEFEIHLQGEDALRIAKLIENSIDNLGTVRFPNSDREMHYFFEKLVRHVNEPEPFILVESSVEPDNDPQNVRVRGIIKASGSDNYQKAREAINHLTAGHLDDSLRGNISFMKILPDMVNDDALARWSIPFLQEVLGSENVILARRITPFSGEDFALFLKQIPGVMFFLGASKKEKDIYAVPHSPHFQVDEEVILAGVKSMAYLLYQYLERK